MKPAVFSRCTVLKQIIMTQEILQECTVQRNVVKLPNKILERNVYLEVKKKLELIGGKWKGGKTQGFVFEEDPTEMLEAIANGENRNLKKEYQFFATPKNLAHILVNSIGYLQKDFTVLEPSAGQGSLIKEFLQFHGDLIPYVDCYEAMEINRMKLLGIEGAIIKGNDFFQCDKKDYYDIIIANPPFAKNQDIDHIRKMYDVCKPGGTIVTLSSLSWLTGIQNKQREFKKWLLELNADVEEIEPGTFKESGTNVGCLMITIKKQ